MILIKSYKVFNVIINVKSMVKKMNLIARKCLKILEKCSKYFLLGSRIARNIYSSNWPSLNFKNN